VAESGQAVGRTPFPGERRAPPCAAVSLLLALLLSVPGPHVPTGAPETQVPRPRAAAAEDVPRRRTGFDGAGVPLVSFNSDTGFGYGAVGGVYFYSPGYVPYRYALAAQVFFTTRGVQSHWLRFDAPDLLPRLRLEVRAEQSRELFSPWYGAGNTSSPEAVGKLVGSRGYAYDLLQPGGFLRLRGKPVASLPAFQPYVGLDYHYTRVRTYAGSVLEREQPRGMAGGHLLQGMAGVLWDTRDDENNPGGGGLEELTVRAAVRGVASEYGFWGATFSERRYVSLGTPRLVLALRGTLDILAGGYPFFELTNVGGISLAEGVGGMSSVRGVPRNRYAGAVKAFVNAELRWLPFEFPLWKAPVRVGGLAFVDAGRVWQVATEDGSFLAWHPGAGLGLRVVRRAAVLRFDAALELETGRKAFYVSFGHMF